MLYRVTLASLSLVPAITAEILVDAANAQDADEKALDRRDDADLKWFKDNGSQYRGDVSGDFAVADGTEPAPTFYTMDNVGQSRYSVRFHDGVKSHSDGSEFYDIQLFRNKKKRDAFIRELRGKGYVPRQSFPRTELVQS